MGKTKRKYTTAFIATIIAVILLTGCSSFDLSEMDSVAVSADGDIAYRVSSHFSSANSKPIIFLDTIDLTTNEVTSTYKLPAGFFHKVYIFTQGSDAYMIIPQDVRSGEPVPCNVYICKPDSSPELLSADEFYLTSQLSEPYIWYDSTVAIGKDANGANSLMYIQNGQVTHVSLDSMEEFASGISSVRHHDLWNYFNNLNFFVVEVRLYDNREFFISPFLTDSGFPIIKEANDDSFGGEDTTIKIAQEYYRNKNMIIVRKENDSSAKLFSVPVANSSNAVNEGTFIETETLYHAVSLGISNSSQLILGYLEPNLEQSLITGYIYDMSSDSLTKLPVIKNMKLDNIVFATSASTKQLLLRVKDSSRYEGTVLIPLPLGTPQYLSTSQYTESLSTKMTKLFGMTEFRVIFIVISCFTVTIPLALIITFIARKKAKARLYEETQYVENRSASTMLNRILNLIGILLLIAFFLLLLLFKTVLPTTVLTLPILGVSFMLISRFVRSSSKRKAKNGILASATIISTRRTGLTINDQPQLEIVVKFITERNEEITAMAKAIIDLTDLALIQAGAMLPIRYDKDNPQNIVIEGKVDPAEHQAAFEKQMIAQGLLSQESLDIARNGTKTQGVVLSSSPTGNIVNGWGEMSLDVRVTRPNNSGTFDTTVIKAIPPAMLAKVLPGAVLNVYYMSYNEQKIVIEMELD